MDHAIILTINKQVLTEQQKSSLNVRLENLVLQFNKAIANGNLEGCKLITLDLHDVLHRLNKLTKLVELKNQLYELSIEEKEAYKIQHTQQVFTENKVAVKSDSNGSDSKPTN